jgi:hypothetical protein
MNRLPATLVKISLAEARESGALIVVSFVTEPEEPPVIHANH